MNAPARPIERWTVLALLRWTTDYFQQKGIPSARLDAELLLAQVLGVERLRLYLDFEKPVKSEERAAFRELVKRRAEERVPVAYLIGEKEFWSLSLRVTEEVLIPRPETEVLVEAALARIPPEAELRVLEIGTGSGALALALAKERPKLRVVATDVSEAALGVAADNAERHGLAGQIHFCPGDLFAPVADERFDLVVSNPPYVPESMAQSLAPELGHEPSLALFAPGDGTGALRSIIEQAREVLEADGWLGLEFSSEQSDVLTDALARAGYGDVEIVRDLAGSARALMARSPSGGD